MERSIGTALQKILCAQDERIDRGKAIGIVVNGLANVRQSKSRGRFGGSREAGCFPEQTDEPTPDGASAHVPCIGASATSDGGIGHLFRSVAKKRTAMRARDLLFVSYSHEDAEWLERLRVMLKPFAAQGRLRVWADAYIQVGDRWHQEIRGELTLFSIPASSCPHEATELGAYQWARDPQPLDFPPAKGQSNRAPGQEIGALYGPASLHWVGVAGNVVRAGDALGKA